MNVFNRIVLLLLCLALAAGAISVIVLAWTIPHDSIEGLRDAVDWLDDHNQDLEKALLTTGGAFVALVAVVVALVELLPKSGAEVKVTDLKVGDAVLSTLSISQRVEEAVSQVAHVAEVRAGVKAKRKGVLLALDLHVDPDVNLADVTDEACQAAQDVLTDRVHVALVEPPRVRLHYRELRLRGRPAPRPGAPTAPEPEAPAAAGEVAVAAPAPAPPEPTAAVEESAGAAPAEEMTAE